MPHLKTTLNQAQSEKYSKINITVKTILSFYL